MPSIRLHAFCGVSSDEGRKDRRAADSPVPPETGLAKPSPEVTELLLRRLGLVWIPEPEDLKPCWNALLSGSPGFFLCYEQLVLPQQERLACSPLAADILLLAAFYTDTMQPLSEEWEPFLSTRQLAL